MGQVFNDASKTCDWPRNVPEWWVELVRVNILPPSSGLTFRKYNWESVFITNVACGDLRKLLVVRP
jgi:hypothetical protein